MLSKLWTYLGWKKNPIQIVTYPATFTFTDNLGLKLQYLKDTIAQEDSRLQILESKTSLLTGQTGIIFSLVGLFIPLYLDKFSHVPGPLKYSAVFVFVMSLGLYLNTILQAIRSLNITRFSYARRNPVTVQLNYATEEQFQVEEVKDLIFCIEQNTALNNYKGGSLIAAYHSFRLGNVAIGILSFLILTSLAFASPDPTPKIEISAPVQIENFDRLIEEMSDEQRQFLKQGPGDTLQIKLFTAPPKLKK